MKPESGLPRIRRVAARRPAALAAIALLWLCTSCSREPSASAPNAAEGPPVPVLAAAAETRDVPVQIPAIGTVEAYSAVSIRPQITGRISRVLFEEGQEVAEGQPLFQLDRSPWEAARAQAQANLARDEAQRVLAGLEFLRTSNLFESHVASQQDYDSANATLRALEAGVMADMAALTNAEVNLGYTTIRAPIAGRTGNLLVKQGSVVKAPDDVLVSLAQMRPIYVTFAVPEQHLPDIRRQWALHPLPVAAVVAAETNQTALGELTFIDNQVDTNTGTILLKGLFPNTNEILWPGQFVQVSLTLSNIPSAIVVPAQAVQSGQGGEFVFVVKPDQTVETRPVEPGIRTGVGMVIRRGVAAGETVVTDGQLRLVPGARVWIRTAGALQGPTNAVPAQP